MEDSELQSAAARMRHDWDERARNDAEYFVYSRTATFVGPDFEESGRANYNQLLRPFLPLLLDGRPAHHCRVLEIGCGVGRMTRWLAEAFGEVHGVDVAPAMIEEARQRLRKYGNVRLHAGSGYDVPFLADNSFDLVFSYIVFQHVPSRAAIVSYIQEAARVLKPGGAFKFQINGDQSPAYLSHSRDTWMGESFSSDEALSMIEQAGFTLMAAEGMGTQYFVLTCRKGSWHVSSPSSFILPGEPWANAQLHEGWGEPVDASWRPMTSPSRVMLALPQGPSPRFYLGLYFWPEEGAETHNIEVTAGGVALGAVEVSGSGDHYLEWDAPSGLGRELEISINITPRCQPAVRILGIYQP